MTGTVILLSSIPFWFLPKSLPKPKKDESQSKSTELATVAEQENFLPEENQDHQEKEKPVTFQEMAKGSIQAFASVQNSVEDCDLFSWPEVVLTMKILHVRKGHQIRLFKNDLRAAVRCKQLQTTQKILNTKKGTNNFQG